MSGTYNKRPEWASCIVYADSVDGFRPLPFAMEVRIVAQGTAGTNSLALGIEKRQLSGLAEEMDLRIN
jgi:hypothetical protein